MVNKQLLEEAAKFETRPRSSGINPNAHRMLVMESEKPYRFTTLCGSNLFLNLRFHTEMDEESKILHNILCEKMYGEDRLCSRCSAKDDKGNAKFPLRIVKAFPAYVHDYEGETRVSQKGKEYDLNPICIVTLRSGRFGKNFKELETLRNSKQYDIFEPGRHVFEIKRTGTGISTVYDPIRKIAQEDLGDEFDPASKGTKDALALFSKKTDDEIYQSILSVFSNVKWEDWGLDEPVADVVESKEVTTNKKAKGALG